MPNWCENNINITHNEKGMVSKLSKALKDGNLFQSIIPMPDDLPEKTLSNGQPPPGLDFNQIMEWHLNNDELCKSADPSTLNWYDWRNRFWGTKADISADDFSIHNEDDYNFHFRCDTAWAPPIPIYDELKRQGFYVEAAYVEPGMDFCGVYINGKHNDASFSGAISAISELGRSSCEGLPPDGIPSALIDLCERYMDFWKESQAENEDEEQNEKESA